MCIFCVILSFVVKICYNIFHEEAILVPADILKILEEEYGNTKSALHYSSVFELLIAVILSAQTNDNQVNKITDVLFQKYNQPEDFAKMPIAELEQYIKTCGLYKNKAKNKHVNSKQRTAGPIDFKTTRNIKAKYNIL